MYKLLVIGVKLRGYIDDWVSVRRKWVLVGFELGGFFVKCVLRFCSIDMFWKRIIGRWHKKLYSMLMRYASC